MGKGVDNMEMVAESKILIVHQVCEKCGEGIMQYDSKKQKLFKDYPHKCDKCGHSEDYPVRYPYQKIVPIEALREPTGNEIT